MANKILGRSMAVAILAFFMQAAVPALADPSETGWQLVWSDEFDGDSLDTTKWNYEEDCWGGGNNERQCYTDKTENVSVKDGVLNITALKKTTRGYAWPKSWRASSEGIWQEGLKLKGKKRFEKAKRPFSSGRITTRYKGDWKYGRFEAKIKLPTGQGAWPAFWMLPSDWVYGGWPLSGEIDIMEAINLGMSCPECEDGREDRVHGTLHFGKAPPKNSYKGKETHLAAPVTGFHTYAIEWEPTQMRWYVDGKHFSTLSQDDWFTDADNAETDHSPFDQRFHIILNLAIGGKWPEESNDVGFFSMDFPKSLVVDYVRVYQCPDGTGEACRSSN